MLPISLHVLASEEEFPLCGDTVVEFQSVFANSLYGCRTHYTIFDSFSSLMSIPVGGPRSSQAGRQRSQAEIHELEYITGDTMSSNTFKSHGGSGMQPASSREEKLGRMTSMEELDS